ncbi:hypothetical protein [Antarctobacter heliothermus]|uniref:Caspase domain protein n=1 Tax=Antarctobacter heliothermus TaxID=74033 RepID=A0A239IXL2_9RHOB|nr:hypothetical protein [Antarctobacter heliothermus]SNS97958.1 hypothetical protein SAMN04488078_104641 [Antarctobacter heliothermus]
MTPFFFPGALRRALLCALRKPAASVATTGLLLACYVASAGSAQADDHILAIGACPAWAGVPPTVCETAVTEVTAALSARYAVPDTQVHTLLNAQATVTGFVDFLNALPAIAADDRVFLYIVMHNGAGHQDRAASAKDDILVFWSDSDPGVIEFALAEGKWLRASDFADAIGQLGMGTLVAFLEDCQSGALGLEILHETTPKTEHVATIASAQAGQYANLTLDYKRPLFSSLLVAAMGGPKETLSELLTTVSGQVTDASGPICAAHKVKSSTAGGFTPQCRQTPVIRDPQAVLPGL